MTIQNQNAGYHPFHLHGYNFQMVHKSHYVFDLDPKINPPFDFIQKNPMRRDTVVAAPFGSVTLRLIADNPGAWFMHCYIAWHLS